MHKNFFLEKICYALFSTCIKISSTNPSDRFFSVNGQSSSYEICVPFW